MLDLFQGLDFTKSFFLDQLYCHQKVFPGMIPITEYNNLEWDEWEYHIQKLREEVEERSNGQG